MSSEALGKTVIKGNWQSFSKKLFQHFIHHKKALKVTKFRSRVLDKNIPLWYIVPPPPPWMLIGLITIFPPSISNG